MQKTLGDPSKHKYDRSEYIRLHCPNPHYEAGYAAAIKDIRRILCLQKAHAKRKSITSNYAGFWHAAMVRLENVQREIKYMLIKRKQKLYDIKRTSD